METVFEPNSKHYSNVLLQMRQLDIMRMRGGRNIVIINYDLRVPEYVQVGFVPFKQKGSVDGPLGAYDILLGDEVNAVYRCLGKITAREVLDRYTFTADPLEPRMRQFALQNGRTLNI
jgi:hypothetical protein